MGKTKIDIEITIPNKKSRSNMKYNANFVKLSDYMDLDERLETDLQKICVIEQEHGDIHIKIKGNILYAIDVPSLLSSMKKIESSDEDYNQFDRNDKSRWMGQIDWYSPNENLRYTSSNCWEPRDLDEWERQLKAKPTEYRDQFGKVIDFSDEETFTWIHNKYMDPEDDKIM